ncbi:MULTISPECIES: dihydrofolate reductase family protein [unclassified Rhizobium]|uniref:dihydrofolate reductase family protein n=1 Tax=Rhizobium TaxID=379 RepID=UPI00084CB148|nr:MULTISPECIES: dihydrofolate reductase family protein [unclassified Rhizobium]OED00356.1 riboflavin biosynthesis protein RibD [Rhizobium sp. YK2]QYA14485.1 dihydrofolate reductase [Rhizobium sp. AB2/73]UEQ82805.1 dihydrofolate reductase [Rhizobium sp. AB2/73]
MRKLVIWNLMTLDGYFEGTKPWDLNFHMLAWGDELEHYAVELGKEGDLLIFGRKTYEGMAAYWPTATETPDIAAYMNGIAKIAASRTLGQADWNNTRVVGDIVAEVKKLKQEPGKTMFVFGSAEVTDTLLKAGLVDELRICLVPVVLGAGNPHFKPAAEQRPMKLIDSTPLKTGAVILRYEPANAA